MFLRQVSPSKLSPSVLLRRSLVQERLPASNGCSRTLSTVSFMENDSVAMSSLERRRWLCTVKSAVIPPSLTMNPNIHLPEQPLCTMGGFCHVCFFSTTATAQQQENKSTPPSSSSSSLNLTRLIKQLRAETGAPVVQCKKALTDSDVNGDIESAKRWLRKSGSSKKAKLIERETSEGLVGLRLSPDGKRGALVKIVSETDFASRSDVFGKLVERVLHSVIQLDGAKVAGGEGDKSDGDGIGTPTTEVDVEGTLLHAPIHDHDTSATATATTTTTTTVKDALDETVLAIRENLQIAEARWFGCSPAIHVKDEHEIVVLSGYVHGRIPNSTCAGTAAALVEIVKKASTTNNDVTKEQMEEAGKKLAMHIVAARPLYLDRESVPSDVVEREREILKEQMADSGKPPDILDKIITGKMNKFYESVCLTEQLHMIEEDNPKVSKVLKKLGLDVRKFERMSVQ